MIDALEEHHGTVRTGGRVVTNLRFADDINGLAEEDEELSNLVNRLGKTTSRYSMEKSRKDTADDKQHETHREEDRSHLTGTGNCESVKVPLSYSQ